jgi:aminocarboxymuconate-semialdehyde decarboxylase
VTGTGKVVDVHAHVTLERFRKAIMQNDDWYGMTSADGELENPLNHWGVDKRLQAMDQMGIDMQLVSATCCFYQYHREARTTARISAEANDELAGMKRDHPARFGGLGTLPMQDTKLTLAEMERGIRELGLDGFMIEDHVNGMTYDLPFFDPFWEAAAGLGALIVFHQNRRTIVDYRTRDYFLNNSIGNLVDRALVFSSLVYGGVMDKYPGLKICLCHAGGYTAFAVDRLDKGWEVHAHTRGKSQAPPSSYLRRFYYDSVTYSARNLRFLIDSVGADRVVFGTDWPAPMVVEDPVRWIQDMPGLTAEESQAILRTNSNELLRLA